MTYGKDVRVAAKNVAVAVGVGFKEVSVLHLLGPHRHAVPRVEGLRRERRLGTRLFVAALGGHVMVGRHPQQRLLMRDDLRIRVAEDLITPGLVGMPVGVEHRMDAVTARKVAEPFEQCAGMRSRTGVDERQAIRAAQRENVTTNAADDGDLVVEADRFRRIRGGPGNEGRRHDGQGADPCLQHRSAADPHRQRVPQGRLPCQERCRG